jgi:hypothetical protein
MAKLSRPYFILALRTAGGSWGADFGDFERATVAAELADRKDAQRYIAKADREQFKLVRAANASRAACDAALAALNAGA